MMISDSQQCVDCQRCVCICPTGALKIVDNPNKFRNNSNWSQQIMTEVYKQAETGGVLLSAMGNPKEYPVYWDKGIPRKEAEERFFQRGWQCKDGNDTYA